MGTSQASQHSGAELAGPTFSHVPTSWWFGLGILASPSFFLRVDGKLLQANQTTRGASFALVQPKVLSGTPLFLHGLKQVLRGLAARPSFILPHESQSCVPDELEQPQRKFDRCSQSEKRPQCKILPIWVYEPSRETTFRVEPPWIWMRGVRPGSSRWRLKQPGGLSATNFGATGKDRTKERVGVSDTSRSIFFFKLVRSTLQLEREAANAVSYHWHAVDSC